MEKVGGLFSVPAVVGSRVRIALPKHANLTVSGVPNLHAGQAGVVVVAHEGLAITGTCIDTEGPLVAGARVYATCGAVERRCTTTESGAFRLTGLAADTSYDLVARAQRRAMGNLSAVASDTAGVRITMKPLPRIEPGDR